MILSRSGPRGFAPASCVVLALLALASPAPANADATGAIRAVVASAHHPDSRWPDFHGYQDEMEALYAPLDYGPVWLSAGAARGQARDVVDLVLNARTRGLDPDDYDASTLESALKALDGGSALSSLDLARFDALVSLAYFRFVSDLRIGRIDPEHLGIGIDVAPKKYDLGKVVRRAIDDDRIRQTVDEAEPPFVQYRRLKETLAAYRSLAADGIVDTVPVEDKVKPGDEYAGLPQLRRILGVLGDLPPGASSGDAGSVYGGAIVEAVKRFQRRHGLEDDGILGKGTLAELNTPADRRIRQIELALERLRWLPDAADGPFLVVNIPAFRLWGWDGITPEGRPSLVMNVVVGKAVKTETPIFTEKMRYIVFRPYWNVPYSILKKEIVPKLRANPDYLATQNMEIVRDFEQAHPGVQTADVETISLLLRGKLHVRQRPGPKNSLGLAKFIFPNNNAIYLHGTPSQSLFSRARRDFSHGCIRLEDPAATAQWVLRDRPEWTRARILAAMQADRPERVDLARPIPVFIFYTTVIVDLEGTVHFFHDVYGHDAKLEAALAEGEPYSP